MIVKKKRELIVEAVKSLGNRATLAQLKVFFEKNHSSINSSDIYYTALQLSVNSHSRISYAGGKKERRTDSGNVYDQLFYSEKKEFEIYEPSVHGVWSILKNEAGEFKVSLLDGQSNLKKVANMDELLSEYIRTDNSRQIHMIGSGEPFSFKQESQSLYFYRNENRLGNVSLCLLQRCALLFKQGVNTTTLLQCKTKLLGSEVNSASYILAIFRNVYIKPKVDDLINSDDLIAQDVKKALFKCNYSQLDLVYESIKILVPLFGAYHFTKYNSNNKVHVDGVEPFSIRTERIQFSQFSDKFISRVDLCFATRNTPSCNLRDPLLKIKFNDGSKRMLVIKGKVQTQTFMNSILSQCKMVEEDEIAPVKVPRKGCLNSYMSFNERTVLLPKVLNYLDDLKFSYDVEAEHPHGRIDIEINKPEPIIVELKYINEDERPIEKIRYAIGQILMYSHDYGYVNKGTEKWIVLNDVQLDRNLKQIINDIEQTTGIKVFIFRLGHLEKVVDNPLTGN